MSTRRRGPFDIFCAASRAAFFRNRDHFSIAQPETQPGYTAVILVPTPLSKMTDWTNTHHRPHASPSSRATWWLFLAIFAAVQLGSLFSPPLLDDVDRSEEHTS